MTGVWDITYFSGDLSPLQIRTSTCVWKSITLLTLGCQMTVELECPN